MKKFFKFFSMALVASALLFTACSKDDEEEVKPTPQNEQNEQNEQSEQSVTATFDGIKYTMNDITANAALYENLDTNYYTFALFASTDKNGTSRIIPAFDLYTYYGTAGEEKIAEVDEYHTFFYDTTLAEITAVRQVEGLKSCGNWCFEKINGGTIKLVDATNLVATFDVDMDVYSMYDYWVLEKKDSYRVKNLKIDAQNIKFTLVK